ncbi:MAG TPA: carbohydrate-binding family V/XII [Nitrospiria bacterium]|nr:carbohydrate-binding family V/XII [Nitrospiria bacterium]
MNTRFVWLRRVSAVGCFVLALAFVPGSGFAATQDVGWPREIKSPEGALVMYEPQIDSFEGTTVTGRAAVAATPAGKKDAVFGAVWFEWAVHVDRDTRTVEVLDVKIPRSRFPGTSPDEEQKLADLVERNAKAGDLTIALDRLLAAVRASEREKRIAEGLNNEPPKILFATEPTLLVVVDGEPQLADMQGVELMRVINTPYFLVFDPQAKRYWLNGGAVWYRAADLKGEWTPSSVVPRAVSAAYRTMQEQVPDEERTPVVTTPSGAKPPKILVSFEPAELIACAGEPTYTPIADNALLYVSNTDQDVFKEIATQDVYVLLSGRWFRGRSFDGPWEFVRSDNLPPAFAEIPEGSKKGSVLAHVAGTPQADEAVLDAQVPQTAAIKRSEARTTVEYDGEPRFQQIPNTEVEYAVNTSSQVLRIKGKYYVCDQAVWFVGPSPDGPWTLADQAPPEVQAIPPDSPVYNVKYVYVYDATPDIVYVGYYPGYMGAYPYYGTVVWGTGWYYRPWITPYVYYPRPWSWGFHAHYNPYRGWIFGVGFASGPFYVSFWNGGGYGGYWGPSYYRPSQVNIIHHVIVTRPAPAERRWTWGTNINVYNRPENRVRNAVVARERPSAARTRPITKPDNVFADQDGRVYRRDKTGKWDTREGRQWKPAPIAPAQPRPGAGEIAPGPRTDPRPIAPPSRPRSETRTFTPPPPGPGDSPARPRPESRASTPPPQPPPRAPSAKPERRFERAPTQSLQRDFSARERGNARVQAFSKKSKERGSAGKERDGGGGIDFRRQPQGR